MKIKQLLFACCLVAGSMIAKKSKCKEVVWPWSHTWAHAKTMYVTNTKAAGEGSFYQVCKQANAYDGPVHICFNIPKKDKGYDCRRNCWTIKHLDEFVIKNKVWIDGFSQCGARPNCNKPCKKNNAKWMIEIKGAPNVDPGSFGCCFDDGSEGSVVTGCCMYNFKKEHGWDAAICTRTSNITIAGVALSTDSCGGDVPNTVSILDEGANNRFGVRGMCEARSIWGGLGSAENKVGALTFKGVGAQLHGGTVGLDYCGYSQLNKNAEVGIYVDAVQEEIANGSNLIIDSVVAAGFSERIICIRNFDKVVVKNSILGTDACKYGPVTCTKISLEVVNGGTGTRGIFDASDNCIGGAKQGVVIGEPEVGKVAEVKLNNNSVGSKEAPNTDNVIISEVENVELSKNNISDATNGGGVTVNEGVKKVDLTDNQLVNNNDTGIKIATPTTDVIKLNGGIVTGNGIGVAVVGGAALNIGDNPNISNNGMTLQILFPF